jgi:diguanylate cyclase (GGDEF)-like protein
VGYLGSGVDGLHGAQIARSQREREQLAKEWLLRLIERTPLDELGELPVAWIVAEAPALIADILARVAGEQPDADVTAAEERLAESLVRLRHGPDAAAEIPRDLAMLHSLLVEALHGGVPRRAGFPQAAERLAEAFGGLQGAVNRSLVSDRASVHELAGPSEQAQAREWLRALLAERARYGHGFGLALVDVDGLSRINEAYGRAAGDRLLGAVGDVIRREVRASDRAFRFGDDEFLVLAPHGDVAGLLVMGERIAELIGSAQAAEGPRIAVAIGVVACPADGDTEEALIESATAATYAAKAAGRAVGTNPDGGRAVLQDR